MSLKKHKIIALATSGVVVSSTLVATGAVLSSNIIAQRADLEAKRQSLHVVPTNKFKWDGKIITGFANDVTASDIDGWIAADSGTLKLPECESIASNAFTFAFKNITTTSFTLGIHKKTKSIGDSAFARNTKITGITFYSETATDTTSLNSIGKAAFEKTGLTSLMIPETVRSIGERAFYKCEQLGSIELDSTKTTLLSGVGDSAFYGIKSSGTLIGKGMTAETLNAIASNFTTSEYGRVNFDNGTTKWSIKNGSSGSTTVTRVKTIPTIYLTIDSNNILREGLKRGRVDDYEGIYIPKEVTKIYDNTFNSATSITSLAFEDNSACTSIGGYAFNGCTNLCSKNANQELVLPAGITNIGWYAFNNCSSIRKLNLGKIKFGNRSRTFSVGEHAFDGWYDQGKRYQSNAIVYPVRESESEGLTQDIVTKTFGKMLSGAGLNKYWYNRYYEPISEDVFNQHATGKQVDINGDENYLYTLTEFDWEGLDVTGLNTLEIPSNYEAIGDGAYWDEETQTSTLPLTFEHVNMANTHVQVIGENAFRGSSIKTVDFSDETTTIGSGSFQDCKNLEGIKIPPLIETIGANAFKGCDNAYYLDLSSLTNEKIQQIIDSDSTDDPMIGDNAFEDFGILQQAGGTIIWPSDIEDKVKTAFVNLLESKGMPDTWVRETTPEEGYTGGIPVKYNSNEILIIDSDKKLTGINWANLKAYVDDVELKTGVSVDSLPLIIPSYVTEIGTNFWSNQDKTGYESLVAKVNSLSFAANSKCTTIGQMAFMEATNFKGSLKIPEGVTKIGADAFYDCTGFDGTLKLPKTIKVDTCYTSPKCGVGQNSFRGCSGFKSLDITSWDKTYVETWDKDNNIGPVAGSAFKDFGVEEGFMVSTGQTISTATLLNAVKWSLCTRGGLRTTVFGEDINSWYESETFDPVDVSSLLSKTGMQAIDTAAKKKEVLDFYIDLINNGEEGKQILEKDLKLTFKNLVAANPAFNPSNAVVNINLENVSPAGDLISFDVTANINIYSDTYKYGYVCQFSTSVKNLQLTSVDPCQVTESDSKVKPTNICFKAFGGTSITTTYDKQYMYGTSNGTEFKKVVVDFTNKEFSFHELFADFADGGAYEAGDDKATRLYELARQEFNAAPSLFGLVLGSYNYGDLYNLQNGCGANGLIYTPYMTTNEDNSTYYNKPLSGRIMTYTLGNLNVYGVETIKDGAVNYTNNAFMYKNYITPATATTHTTFDDTNKAYYAYLFDETQGYTPVKGELFREEILNSVLTVVKGFIASSKTKAQYIEIDKAQFYQLTSSENGSVLPVVKNIGTTDNPVLVANFGINISLYMHDDVFVTSGDTSSYKHAYEIYLPLEFRDVVLNYRYTYTESETRVNGLLWKIFDTADAVTAGLSPSITFKSWTVDEHGNPVGPLLRKIDYNETSRKFDVTKLAEGVGTIKWADINGEMRAKHFASISELESYMTNKWPLLSYLNFIRADKDNSGIYYVSLGFNSKFLKNITW